MYKTFFIKKFIPTKKGENNDSICTMQDWIHNNHCFYISVSLVMKEIMCLRDYVFMIKRLGLKYRDTCT